jgi:F-type H+-transporting ATPase subunit alpha
VKTLEEFGAMDYTTIVASTASELAPLQYIAPYAGCAIGEEWMENGEDVLVIYDDLSKHATAYRTLSLLLRRPPGRESYPGDVFYLHSRLLERAARLSDKLGGGSLTALPIIETQAGDVSAYIPTNVISITDGQIYLETEMFNAGFRPAVNAGLSVSRVGGSAQIKAMKKIAGPIRTDLAQYRELAAFSQFGSELDDDTKERLAQGERIREILKQPQYQPMPVEKQVVIIYAATKKYLLDIEVADIMEFEKALFAFIDTKYPEIFTAIREEKVISDATEELLVKAITECKKEFLK